MADVPKDLIGRLAVHYQMISSEQLQKVQAQLPPASDPSAALREQGLITDLQLDQLRRAATEYLARLKQPAPISGRPTTPNPQPAIPNTPTTAPSPPSPPIFERARTGGPPPAPKTGQAKPAMTPPAKATPPGRPGAPKRKGDLDAKSSAHQEWLHRILTRAAADLASDVHIHAGSPIRIRLRGELVTLNPEGLRAADAKAVLRTCCTEAQWKHLKDFGEVDFAYELRDVARFRVNVYEEQQGYCGVFHRIPTEPPSLIELGLPSSISQLTHHRNGLVLIAGPAGSGKTSTMAALVAVMNESRNDHILTMEDPIEFRFSSKRCIINQREVGTHTHTFSAALKSALREDPDVICVGELRELETIELALTAAETGHLVIATIHTLGSVRTLNRVIGAYPTSEQPRVRAMLAESLRGILSQKLVPRADQTDMALAYELLLGTQASANLIREGRTYQLGSVIQTGRQQGMRLLDDSLIDLVKGGHITKESAREHAENPTLFR